MVFYLIILPILVVLITVMNILLQRGFFQALNIIVVGIVLMLLVSMLLVESGFYNTAVTSWPSASWQA